MCGCLALVLCRTGHTFTAQKEQFLHRVHVHGSKGVVRIMHGKERTTTYPRPLKCWQNSTMVSADHRRRNREGLKLEHWLWLLGRHCSDTGARVLLFRRLGDIHVLDAGRTAL